MLLYLDLALTQISNPMTHSILAGTLIIIRCSIFLFNQSSLIVLEVFDDAHTGTLALF